jgi:hypothetical protein
MSRSFVHKGMVAKYEALRKVLRSELSKERVTWLDGNFGSLSEFHVLLDKSI